MSAWLVALRLGEFIAVIGISVFLLGIKERLSKNPLPKQVFSGRYKDYSSSFSRCHGYKEER